MINGFKSFIQRAKSIALGPLASMEKMIVESMGGGWGFLRRSVNAESAMAIPTVYACVGIRAQSIAMTPFRLYKKTATGKKAATDHPIFKLTKSKVNKYLTSFMFREYMQTCLDLKGNAYAQIVWEDGYPVEMYPIDPSRVRIKIEKGIKTFRVAMADGREEEFQREEILHLSNVSLDGVYGASVLALHRATFELVQQQTDFAQAVFDNSARPSGAFSAPGELSEVSFNRLKEQLKKEWTGSMNAGKPMLLEGGLTFSAITMNAQDLAYIEQRKLTQLDICQIFQTPPHMVGILDRATFSNIEEQNIDFYRRTLMALFIRWETEHDTTLLLEKEQVKYYFRFDARAFLRGNTESRYRVYQIARNWGIMSLNEIRELEDMELLPPDIGDVHLEPLNMKKAGEDDPNQDQGNKKEEDKLKGPNKGNTKSKGRSAPKPGTSDDDSHTEHFVNQTLIRDGFQDIFEDLIGRTVSKHCLSLRKKLPQVANSDEWRAHYCGLMLKERANVLESLANSIGGYARMIGIDDEDAVRDIRDKYVTGFIARAVEDLDRTPFEPARAEILLDSWLTSRAAKETKELFAILEGAA